MSRTRVPSRERPSRSSATDVEESVISSRTVLRFERDSSRVDRSVTRADSLDTLLDRALLPFLPSLVSLE